MFTLKSLSLSLGFSVLTFMTSGLFASNSTDRIIGDNDLVQVTEDSTNRELIHAIGLMKLGCTATHLGNGIAITAGHCFARDNFKGVRENLPCSDDRLSVRWGVTKGSRGYLSSQCTEVIATELNSERDYAIFRVSPIPDGEIRVASNTAELNSKISIYSHPRKRPLEWSQWCTVEGMVEKSHGHQFYYSCDTEGGSSGAAVLNEDYQVVGIHNFYSLVLNRNAATSIFSTPIFQILN